MLDSYMVKNPHNPALPQFQDAYRWTHRHGPNTYPGTTYQATNVRRQSNGITYRQAGATGPETGKITGQAVTDTIALGSPVESWRTSMAYWLRNDAATRWAQVNMWERSGTLWANDPRSQEYSHQEHIWRQWMTQHGLPHSVPKPFPEPRELRHPGLHNLAPPFSPEPWPRNVPKPRTSDKVGRLMPPLIRPREDEPKTPLPPLAPKPRASERPAIVTAPSPDGLPKPGPQPLPRHRLDKPKAREKESKKGKAERLAWFLGNVVGGFSEWQDMLDAAWTALPKGCKSKSFHGGAYVRPNKLKRQADVYRCWQHADIVKFVDAFAKNHIEDFLIGKTDPNARLNKAIGQKSPGIARFNSQWHGVGNPERDFLHEQDIKEARAKNWRYGDREAERFMEDQAVRFGGEWIDWGRYYRDANYARRILGLYGMNHAPTGRKARMDRKPGETYEQWVLRKLRDKRKRAARSDWGRKEKGK
jgi:hypothetical protein